MNQQYEVTVTLTRTHSLTSFGTIAQIAKAIGLDPENPYQRKALEKAIQKSLSMTQKQQDIGAEVFMDKVADKVERNGFIQSLIIDAEVM